MYNTHCGSCETCKYEEGQQIAINDIEIKHLVKDKNIDDLILKNHYSHKIPKAIKFRFGFYYKNCLIGGILFNIPANQYAFTSIFNDVSQSIGLELGRVWLSDKIKKNGESYLISKCFEFIKQNSEYKVIVSYADSNFGHVGYIYQALNGIYLGLTNDEIRYILNGELITRRGLGRSKGDTESAHVKRLLAAGAKKIKMKGKHKYIWIIADKRTKKILLNCKMKKTVKILPYPKIDKEK
jgi:hypothetical protein